MYTKQCQTFACFVAEPEPPSNRRIYVCDTKSYCVVQGTPQNSLLMLFLKHAIFYQSATDVHVLLCCMHELLVCDTV